MRSISSAKLVPLLLVFSIAPTWAHSAKKARKPAGAETAALDVNESGEVKVDGKAVTIQAGKSRIALMVARIEDAMPVGDAPVFRLQPLSVHSRETMEGKTTVTKVDGGIRAFQGDSSWMFYQDENHLDSAHEVSVSFPPAAEEWAMLKGKVAVFPVPADQTLETLQASWNECGGAGGVTGNYTGYECIQNRKLADEYLGFIRDHMLACVSQASTKAGIGAATKVHIVHDGTMGDARHQKTRSLHNLGRAVDVQQMVVTTASGTHTFDFRQTNTNHRLSATCAPAGTAMCKFYEAFRTCWHGLMVGRSCPGNRNPKRRWIGTLGWEDRQHIAHHLHTSMPFCPRSDGHWTTAYDDEADGEDEMGGNVDVPAGSPDGAQDI